MIARRSTAGIPVESSVGRVGAEGSGSVAAGR